MKFKSMLMSLLGVLTLQTKEGKPDLSEDESHKLNSLLGEENAATLIEQVTAGCPSSRR